MKMTAKGSGMTARLGAAVAAAALAALCLTPVCAWAADEAQNGILSGEQTESSASAVSAAASKDAAAGASDGGNLAAAAAADATQSAKNAASSQFTSGEVSVSAQVTAASAVASAEAAVSSSANGFAEDSAVEPAADPTDDSANDPAEEPVLVPGFQKSDGTGIKYVKADRSYAVSEFVIEGGKTYYIGADGYQAYGLTKVNGTTYCLGETDGALRTGWVTWKDGSKSYADDKGVATSGWRIIDKKKYYFDPATFKAAKWLTKIGGSYYYFNSQNVMHTGWLTWKADGRKSYFDPSSGKAYTGKKTISKKTYYFDPKTTKAAKWLTKIDGKYYYFNAQGVMHTGWLTWKADGRRSYFKSDGSAATGWMTISNKKYYFDPKTTKAWRWEHTIGGYKYYFERNGAMHTGWLTWKADGKKSYFGKNGRALTGWQTISGKKYYFNPSTAKSARYLTKIDGKYYYFNNQGVMHTGWLTWKADGKRSYFNKNGVMLTGKQKIDGVTYNFGTSGKIAADPVRAAMAKKVQGYSSNTKYLIAVDTKNNRLGVFTGGKGNWKLQKYWQCSTGAPGTPTVLGQYTVGAKGYSFGSGFSCYYYTQFYGDYLIHSVTYYQGTRRIMEGKMGVNISHGCVRLQIENAKWIYDNVPRSTKVLTYRG